MKGLLYKDYINGRGIIYIVVGYAVVIYSMLVSFGNEINMAEGLEERIEAFSDLFMMPFFFTSIICILPVMMAIMLCALDAKTKWNNYAMALPGGYKMLVKEKYILLAIAHVSGTLLGLACLPIVKYLFRIEAEGILIESNMEMLLVMILAVMGASMVATALIVPLMIRRVTWVDLVTTVILIIFIYGLLTYAAFGDLSFFEDPEMALKIMQWFIEHKNIIWVIGGGSVAGGILCQVVSYLLTKKMFLRLVG